MKKKYITNNYEETQKLGASFADKLNSGAIVLLFGDLGSGKTTFCKGILENFKYQYDVTSPTFF